MSMGEVLDVRFVVVVRLVVGAGSCGGLGAVGRVVGEG